MLFGDRSTQMEAKAGHRKMVPLFHHAISADIFRNLPSD